MAAAPVSPKTPSSSRSHTYVSASWLPAGSVALPARITVFPSGTWYGPPASIVGATFWTPTFTESVAPAVSSVLVAVAWFVMSCGPSSTLTGSVSVTNVGDAPADSVVLTDTLPPAWITLASFTPPKGGKCTGTSPVVCQLPAIAVGATVVFTGVLDVDRDTPANEVLTNQVELSSSASFTSDSQTTTVYRTRATDPGDCNGDTAVDAADITSIVLWIFEGAYKGVTGCDANQDTRVDAGDITCAVLMIFGGPNACSLGGLNSGQGRPVTPDPDVPSTGPVLSMPGEVRAESGGRGMVPVSFRANGHEISSMVFSVDYDETRLSFDPTDGNGDESKAFEAFPLFNRFKPEEPVQCPGQP